MKREIKFRAWGKDNNSKYQMYYNVQNSYDIIGQVQPEDCWDNFTDVLNNCDVMQFTGLKDKNGKEIYEGDILLMDYGLPYCPDIPHLKGKALIVVKYELNYCEEYGNIMGYNIDCDEATIIGNIYENPELLENEK